MTYDASTFLGEKLPRKKLDFLWFSCFADCNLCYLFHRENLASSYKCSNVMQRMRQDKQEYHMDGTLSSERNIYLSGAHKTGNTV